MNIWAWFFGAWNLEKVDFPFNGFQNKDELLNHYVLKFGEDCSQGLYYSALTEAPLNLIYNEQIQGWIQKHLYCKQYHTAPFKGSYEEIPAYWIDFVQIYDNEIAQCKIEARRKNGNG